MQYLCFNDQRLYKKPKIKSASRQIPPTALTRRVHWNFGRRLVSHCNWHAKPREPHTFHVGFADHHSTSLTCACIPFRTPQSRRRCQVVGHDSEPIRWFTENLQKHNLSSWLESYDRHCDTFLEEKKTHKERHHYSNHFSKLIFFERTGRRELETLQCM